MKVKTSLGTGAGPPDPCVWELLPVETPFQNSWIHHWQYPTDSLSRDHGQLTCTAASQPPFNNLICCQNIATVIVNDINHYLLPFNDYCIRS